MKVGLLSNINADYILRFLGEKIDCVPSVGYGDVWGQILNPVSDFNFSNPDVIVFLIDIEQLLDNCLKMSDCISVIDNWFSVLDLVLRKDKEYYVSNVLFRSELLTENDSFMESDIIQYWNESLKRRVNSNSNVHLVDVNSAIVSLGKKKVFSNKLWYLGKIPYSNEGCRIVADAIMSTLSLIRKSYKKVLVLDLDNTLWGGVLGELGVEGINLSDDHIGAIFKKVQQQIKSMKDSGTILAIVSKNNESDVQEVWDRHSHMVLKREDFVSIRINWIDKAENIRSIAKELNLGTDSFVFIDDMEQERANIRMRMSEVVVPDFPKEIEDYPLFIKYVYETFFKQTRLSNEDCFKTRQYAENALRAEASKNLSFEDFLKSLQLSVKKLELDNKRLDRVAQLLGKTNQFNLTTIRYTRKDIDALLSAGYDIYAYNVSDKFGDYGLVAVVIVDLKKSEIDSFLMSCRVMGKLVENYVINDVEQDLLKKGHSVLHARYVKTVKNVPVASFFDKLGYIVTSRTESEIRYEICLTKRPKRKFFVKR